MTQYPTDLTEKQWQVIKNILEPQARNRKHPLKEIMNAILYINKTGCQWRMLPSDFAPWQTVYYYFRKWKLEGVFEEVMDALHSLIRKQAGREESPSLGTIHEANLHDSKGAPQAIEKLAYKFPRLVKILADGGYRGDLADWVKKKFGWILEVVLRPDECPSKFQVLPKRWIVERSFSWLENFRRLTIDYEFLAETAEAMVQIAFIQIMLNRFIE